MLVSEKISYLQKVFNLNTRQFSKEFKIKKRLLDKILANEIEVEKESLIYLCKQIEVDLDDFMSPNSVMVSSQIQSNEHICKSTRHYNETDISEDFPREDNSRYEEKD